MFNPVFKRELRTSLRTPRTFVSISVYVIIMAGITAISLAVLSNNTMYRGFVPSDTVMLYIIMAGFQLGLITLITPALAASAISGERERQTLDLMLVTKMSTLSIVVGKLAASLSIVLLITAASLPVFGIAMYYGSVDLLNVFIMAVFTLSVSALVGGVAIFFSSLLKRNITSIIATYIFILFLTIGNAFLLFVSTQIARQTMFLKSGPSEAAVEFLMAFNPFFGFMSLQDALTGSSNLRSLSYSLVAMFSYNAQPSGGDLTGLPLPVWACNMIFNVVMAVVFIALAAVVIKPVKKKRKYR